MALDFVESKLRLFGGLAGLAVLLVSLTSIFKSLRRPASFEEPGARIVLRRHWLTLASVAFIGAGFLLWRPLPLKLSPWPRRVLLLTGGVPFFGGLVLYLWGLRTLGPMFAPSSGFGVRLQAEHRLITAGPYAWVRHPMYLAALCTALGGMLLYRTWTMLCFAILMFGLVVRARREERILAAEFGPAWQAYVSRVPAWLPRPSRCKLFL